MLSKINRLTKKKDFELIFKKGEVFKKDFLLFKTIKNLLGEGRFGFVVSKKVSNKASVRNKVKRRLRQAVLNKLKEFQPIKSAKNNTLDVVIVALPGIEKKEFTEIQKLITEFFKKYT